MESSDLLSRVDWTRGPRRGWGSKVEATHMYKVQNSLHIQMHAHIKRQYIYIILHTYCRMERYTHRCVCVYVYAHMLYAHNPRPMWLSPLAERPPNARRGEARVTTRPRRHAEANGDHPGEVDEAHWPASMGWDPLSFLGNMDLKMLWKPSTMWMFHDF